MKKFTLALFLVLMVTGCAKDSNDGAGADGQQIATVPNPENSDGNYQPGYQPGNQPGYQQGHGLPPYGYQPQGRNCDTNYQQFTTLDQYCRALRIDIRRNRCVTVQHTTAYRQFCEHRR